MADNQNTQQKYFLDLGGLTTLWGKIKSSFADKTTTETAIGEINVSLGELDTKITSVDNDVVNLETTVLTFAPRDVNYYGEAVEISKSLAAGTLINIKSTNTSAEDETPSGYASGIYVVVAPGEIQYLSTSDGSADADDITAITERVKSLEETTVKSAQIIDENGNQLNQSYDVVDNVLIVAHDDHFDIDTNSVRALTHRAVAAKFKSIENTLTQIPKFKISVVDELPTSGISLSTIYLLRNTQSTSNNLFTEYIYVESVKDDPSTTDVNESKYVWEKLGEQTLVVDDIITTAKLNEILNSALVDYAKKTDVQDLLKDATDSLRSDIFNEISENYATKESLEELSKDIEGVNANLENYLTKNDAAGTYLRQDVAESTYFTKNAAETSGWMTEPEIILSIQTGEIGNAIAISNEQIENMTTNNN